MGAALKYWKFVTIDGRGRSKKQEISEAKAFWQQQFPEFANATEVPDAQVQRHLFQLMQADSSATESDRTLAECCLRCFISHQIAQTCLQLAKQFGRVHRFEATDLFPVVLTDTLDALLSANRARKPLSNYQSLATKILQTFDPAQASLSTWTARLVRRHPELNTVLLEYGVYLISDWAILNDTTLNQVQRVLKEFHKLTDAEITQAVVLLESYQEIYQRDRLLLRQSGASRLCADPTDDQLAQIAQLVEPSDPSLSPEQTLNDLRTLAQRLREYRIAVRSGRLPTQSIDDPIHSLTIAALASPSSDEAGNEDDFLAAYRRELLDCLDRSIAGVMHDRLAYHQRRKPPTDQLFLEGLRLFYCQGERMGDIAPQIGLREQYQVTRLLKLKELRADVRQNWLLNLRQRIRELAQTYVDLTQLEHFDQQLEAVLDQQIKTLTETASAEASVANRSPTSVFARRLCSYLDKRRS